MNRNCPNCGAPYDVKYNKCPYCETSYFDFAALSLEPGKPFYFKIKQRNGAVFTCKCMAEQANVDIHMDSTSIYNPFGYKVAEYYSSTAGRIEMSFNILNMENDILYTIEEDQE